MKTETINEMIAAVNACAERLDAAKKSLEGYDVEFCFMKREIADALNRFLVVAGTKEGM